MNSSYWYSCVSIQLKQEVDNNPELNSSKKKKEQEKFQTMISTLQEELRQQTENHKFVLARIDHEKSTYFNTNVTRNRSITQFLQLCIFPRCCFTMTDALFCAQFVLMLHAQKTPHFSTLLFYDRVFSDISYTVTCCTENEKHFWSVYNPLIPNIWPETLLSWSATWNRCVWNSQSLNSS